MFDRQLLYFIFFYEKNGVKVEKKAKLKSSIIKSLPINENKRDTFENEKVHEEDMSGEEDEE